MAAKSRKNTTANANDQQTAQFPAPRDLTKEQSGESQTGKAQKALRIELAKTISQIDEAIGSNKLNDWEKGFLSDMASRFKQFGLKARMSVSQLMILNRCVFKAAA